jgi:hypothetical protein
MRCQHGAAALSKGKGADLTHGLPRQRGPDIEKPSSLSAFPLEPVNILTGAGSIMCAGALLRSVGSISSRAGAQSRPPTAYWVILAMRWRFSLVVPSRGQECYFFQEFPLEFFSHRVENDRSSPPFFTHFGPPDRRSFETSQRRSCRSSASIDCSESGDRI